MISILLSTMLFAYGPQPAPQTQPTLPQVKRYVKRDIVKGRFNSTGLEEAVKKAQQLKAEVKKSILGEDDAAEFLQEKVIEYLETYGTHHKEPVAANFIGLPGIGKSDMIT